MKATILIIMSMVGILSKPPLAVTSSAFNDGDPIPAKYTCEGLNVSPPLEIRDIPHGAKSLVVIMEDPDAPRGGFDHWVVWNITPAPITMIEENTTMGIVGKNGKNENAYTGPCPPSGTHHYHIRVFALNTILTLQHDAGKADVMQAMNSHILASGELIGLYEKNRSPELAK